MLQRIQSVWLFFASAALFSLFLFPYIQVINPDGSAKIIKITGVYQQLADQIVQTQPFTLLTIATVIIALIPFAIIFFYKKRGKQIMAGYTSVIIILGYAFWMAQIAKQNIEGVELKIENYGIGVLLPSVAILFIILAVKGIRRDEKLIKSADRLR